MNNCLRNDDRQVFDLKIESRLEWNELVKSEVTGLRVLESLGSNTRNYVPVMIDEEIHRRRVFLKELLDNT